MKRNFVLIIMLAFCPILSAQSFLTPSDGYQTDAVLADQTSFSCYDFYDNLLYANDGAAVYCYDLTDESLVATFEKPDYYSGYPSFLTVSPDGLHVWVGFTSTYNEDDRIFSINTETGAWEQKAGFAANFDLEFFGENIFVSGLNSTDWNIVNSIFLLDPSGADNHRKIIEISGSAAGFTIDSDGNFYNVTSIYGMNNFLYRWQSEAVAAVVADPDAAPLTVADATILSIFPVSAYDCDADEGNNIVFDYNDYAGEKVIAIWNGVEGAENNYEVIAFANDEMTWLGMIKVRGNISETGSDNAVFAQSYAQPLARVYRVPVPVQYITEVLEYTPAPGQFINSSPWGNPYSAQSLVGNVSGSLNLGSFGGYVIFKFETSVENDPNNPFGVDFTIFGNPMETWSEPGVVSVMKDENGNGLADDTWYELAGSDYRFSTTIKNYQVTYVNPHSDSAADVSWTDNLGNTGFVFANDYYAQPYYPISDSFPQVNDDQYTLSGTRLVNLLDSENPAFLQLPRRSFGYVDNQLRGTTPYTVPDNPYTSEKENSGGDAFDIHWAVDENGNYVDLDAIDFVKVQGAILADAGWLGEVSTEITGAVDVEPNAAITGVLDCIVIKDVPKSVYPPYNLEVFAFYQGRWQENADIQWTASLDGVTIDENNVLTTTQYGEVTLTAFLADNPEISKSVTTVLMQENSIAETWMNSVKIYPNPTDGVIFVDVDNQNVDIDVFNLLGQQLGSFNNGNQTTIDISDFPSGCYLLKISGENQQTIMKKIIKR